MSTIINVRFTEGIMAVTEPQYQYNYGQILKIDGVELPTAYQVHFSNERLGSSITVIGNADGVKIPEQFFSTCKNIYVWVYLHEGLEDGETVYQVIIPIKARAAITDEEPTHEEQSTISQIIEALNDAVDKAEDAVTKYPTIVDGYWYVWDAVNEQWLSTNVKATGEQGIQGQKGQKGDKGQDYILTAADKVEIAEMVEDNVNDFYPKDKVSGTIASFVDGADDIPIKSLTITFEPIQDTSQGEPSLENICPITGHTGFNMYKAGGNLICKTLPSNAITTGSISTGSTTLSTGSTFKTYCVYVGKNTDICFRKFTTGQFTVGLAFADENLTQRDGSVIYNALNMASRENNTLNSGSHPYLVICAGKNVLSDDGSIDSRQVTVFFKNDDAPESFFPASNIEKYSYDWTEEAGTVFGAKLNVLTGVLTIDMVCRQVTASYLSSVASGYIGYSAGVTALGGKDAVWVRNLFNDAKERKSGGIKAKCNAFGILMNSTAVSSSQDRTAFAVDGTAVNSVETFIGAVQELENNGEGLYVAYELATPVEYQLETHQLSSILGGNQIWTDTGTIDVEYRADVNLYVDKKIQEAISALS